MIMRNQQYHNERPNYICLQFEYIQCSLNECPCDGIILLATSFKFYLIKLLLFSYVNNELGKTKETNYKNTHPSSYHALPCISAYRANNNAMT